MDTLCVELSGGAWKASLNVLRGVPVGERVVKYISLLVFALTVFCRGYFTILVNRALLSGRVTESISETEGQEMAFEEDRDNNDEEPLKNEREFFKGADSLERNLQMAKDNRARNSVPMETLHQPIITSSSATAMEGQHNKRPTTNAEGEEKEITSAEGEEKRTTTTLSKLFETVENDAARKREKDKHEQHEREQLEKREREIEEQAKLQAAKNFNTTKTGTRILNNTVLNWYLI